MTTQGWARGNRAQHLRSVKRLDLRPRFRRIGPQGIAESFALAFPKKAVGACRYAKGHTRIPLSRNSFLVQAAGANPPFPSRSNPLRSAAFVAFTGLGWEGLSILV